MAKEIEPCAPFSCHDAINLLCKRSRRSTKPIVNELSSYLNIPLISLYKSNFYVLFELVKLCGVSLCIIGQKTFPTRKKYACLLDMRYIDEFFPLTRPVYWLIDQNSKKLLTETVKSKKIPTLNSHVKRLGRLKSSLWDILQVKNNETVPEPQNGKDLKQVLEKYNLLHSTHVSFCISISPQHDILWIKGHTTSPVAPLSFFAYTKHDLSIGYTFRQPKHLTHHSLDPSKNQSKYGKSDEDSIKPKADKDDKVEEEEENDLPPDPNTANRRISVNVKLTGLNLAHTLGICTHDEMVTLSHSLAQCAGAMWFTCDEKIHIRHAVYKDAEFNKVIEIPCGQKDNTIAWTFFSKLLKKEVKK